MANDVKLKKTYKVAKRDVFLSLIIGEGQFGSTDVFLDDQRILRTSGSFGKLRIGKGAEVAGKTLSVSTIVNDTVAQTNRMSVTYKLTGGTGPSDFPSKGTIRERNHQGMGNELIQPLGRIDGQGVVRRRPRMGGMLNFYYRAAA